MPNDRPDRPLLLPKRLTYYPDLHQTAPFFCSPRAYLSPPRSPTLTSILLNRENRANPYTRPSYTTLISITSTLLQPQIQPRCPLTQIDVIASHPSKTDPVTVGLVQQKLCDTLISSPLPPHEECCASPRTPPHVALTAQIDPRSSRPTVLTTRRHLNRFT